ncbi:MAG TPA: hypothetical protein VEJ18_11100, partial [Planctomycetota bacterium]|nr:hypothetical protein [Planctomycetota bacterium]
TDAWVAQSKLEEKLELPIGAEDVGTVPKLARRLEKLLGVRVLVGRDAWTSTTRLAPKPGEKIYEVLESLAAAGIRAVSRDGVLYLLK